MKRHIFILTILLGIGAGITTTRFFNTAPVIQPSPVTVAKAKVNVKVPSTIEPTLSAELSTPIRVIIPKLKVDAVIEQVGQDAQGNMDVPQDFNNVGWYKLGVKPGAIGNAVLAGHLDTPNGSEAVFYGLSTLVPGDVVTVIDEKDKKQTFVVMEKEAYDTKSFPLQKVFGSTNGRSLNLITCEGTFNKSEKMYSQRLVIFTKLQES